MLYIGVATGFCRRDGLQHQYRKPGRAGVGIDVHLYTRRTGAAIILVVAAIL
jgi:hypothetical protein